MNTPSHPHPVPSSSSSTAWAFLAYVTTLWLRVAGVRPSAGYDVASGKLRPFPLPRAALDSLRDVWRSSGYGEALSVFAPDGGPDHDPTLTAGWDSSVTTLSLLEKLSKQFQEVQRHAIACESTDLSLWGSHVDDVKAFRHAAGAIVDTLDQLDHHVTAQAAGASLPVRQVLIRWLETGAASQISQELQKQDSVVASASARSVALGGLLATVQTCSGGVGGVCVKN